MVLKPGGTGGALGDGSLGFTLLSLRRVLPPMSTERETEVTDRGDVVVPADLLEEADVRGGDRIRWRLTDDGRLVGEVIRERAGAFEDFEPVDMGETDAVDVTERGAYEPGRDA
jgi:bifunctional DNA-binding transcriptional regulator/antitoxin component of YhaV-PrlF toxin-antitoxin module